MVTDDSQYLLIALITDIVYTKAFFKRLRLLMIIINLINMSLIICFGMVLLIE